MRLGEHSLHGYSLRAQLQGSAGADAPLLLFVHGMMEPPEVWAPVIAALGGRYRCVLLDLPWNGQQGGLWGQDMRPEDWLHAALDAFELEPDAWVAHSFGASTLLALLAGAGQRGRHVPAVLISPFYKASPAEVTWPLFQHYVNRFTDFVEMSIRVRLPGRDLDAEVLQRMTATARDAFGCYVWVQFWQLFARMPFLPLQGLAQPVFTLTGAEDFSSLLPDVAALNAALPNGRLQVFADGGHFLLSSHGAPAASAVARFLDSVCPAPESLPAPDAALFQTVFNPVNHPCQELTVHGYA